MAKLRLVLPLLLALAQCASPALADNVQASEAKAAIELYNQKQYVPAVTAFEKIIARQATANYLYYAALSNRAAHREMRAQQLFQFIVKSYPNSMEATYAKQALASSPNVPATTSGASTDSPSELPESVKALIPPEMLKMMQSAEGKRAVADAMHQNADKVSTIREAERKGVLSPTKMAAVVPTKALAVAATQKGTGTDDHPFTPADIARQGASAIDQMRYPNCWFEASMAALAELPRGQRLISGMIRRRAPDTYVVRFPGDGVEYVITNEDLDKAKIHDSGLWASLIECAQTRKFPDNEGAEGAEGDMSRLQVGLGCITGCKAEVLNNLTSRSQSELSSFIGSAVKSQNPVVAGTYPEYYLANLPEICVPQHAYTITGFDPAHNMITIRNPHGKNADRFELPSDPHHEDFEQLDAGVFKMSIRVFQRYFYSVCRSFI